MGKGIYLTKENIVSASGNGRNYAKVPDFKKLKSAPCPILNGLKY
jgi:hypothetical protein